jgi:hypothetical protein
MRLPPQAARTEGPPRTRPRRMDQSREAHLAARQLHSPEGELARWPGACLATRGSRGLHVAQRRASRRLRRSRASVVAPISWSDQFVPLTLWPWPTLPVVIPLSVGGPACCVSAMTLGRSGRSSWWTVAGQPWMRESSSWRSSSGVTVRSMSAEKRCAAGCDRGGGSPRGCTRGAHAPAAWYMRPGRLRCWPGCGPRQPRRPVRGRPGTPGG